MLYLGIDIAKNNHVASLLDDNAKLLFKAFTFSNTVAGANSLLGRLSSFISTPADVEVGMEATGHYWLSIYSFLVENGYTVHVVNPIQTDGWRKGTEIRKRKRQSRGYINTGRLNTRSVEQQYIQYDKNAVE